MTQAPWLLQGDCDIPITQNSSKLESLPQWRMTGQRARPQTSRMAFGSVVTVTNAQTSDVHQAHEEINRYLRGYIKY